MKWRESRISPLGGALNAHILTLDKSNIPHLLREPLSDIDVLREIKFEYEQVGFLETAGKVRRRSDSEQAEFSFLAARHGLRVLAPSYYEPFDKQFYYRYLTDAEPIDIYLKKYPQKTLLIFGQLVEDLRKAHRGGIVYGDRWTPNILVDPLMGLIHIDFDLEISGPRAIEFEVAQAIYYTLLHIRKGSVGIFANEFTKLPWFDKNVVINFLEKHVRFFEGTKYGGSENQVTSFISQLES